MLLRETGVKPKVTTIVATKRHHIRFFPDRGDRTGNALPGTLVETEVTHPFHYDFYLCLYVAIQGTAHLVRYHIIEDDVKMSVDRLQAMIYQQCYQYQRSTTPVSLHPALPTRSDQNVDMVAVEAPRSTSIKDKHKDAIQRLARPRKVSHYLGNLQ